MFRICGRITKLNVPGAGAAGGLGAGMIAFLLAKLQPRSEPNMNCH